MAVVFTGAAVVTSQQQALLIVVSGAASRFFALLGQQQAERTLPSMLHRYEMLANAADGSRTANISMVRAMRRTAR